VLIVEYVDCEGTFVSAPEIGQQNKEFPVVNANFSHVTEHVAFALPSGESDDSGNRAVSEPTLDSLMLVLEYVISDARRVHNSAPGRSMMDFVRLKSLNFVSRTGSSARRVYDAKCGRGQELSSRSDIDEYSICQHRIV
jgi:hypothetical protein